MAAVNNVIRLLESRKIPYKVYHLPQEKLSAEETAKFLRIPLDIVFKTIVVTRVIRGKLILAIIPGTCTVDLKALAKELGEKKLVLPTQREAEELTGLQAGGISPIALLNRGFQMVIDDSVKTHHEIHISGGELGLNICISVEEFVKLINARTAKICSRK